MSSNFVYTFWVLIIWRTVLSSPLGIHNLLIKWENFDMGEFVYLLQPLGSWDYIAKF